MDSQPFEESRRNRVGMKLFTIVAALLFIVVIATRQYQAETNQLVATHEDLTDQVHVQAISDAAPVKAISDTPIQDIANTQPIAPKDDFQTIAGTVQPPPKDDHQMIAGTIQPPPKDDHQTIAGTIQPPPKDDYQTIAGTIQPPPKNDASKVQPIADTETIQAIADGTVPPMAAPNPPPNQIQAISDTRAIQAIADTLPIQAISDTKMAKKLPRKTIQKTGKKQRRLSPTLNYSESRSTIFISMPSYRDNECWKTIVDAYAQAAHPERIFFGVFQQHDPSEKDCYEFANVLQCFDNTKARHPLCGRFEQVQIHRVHYNDSRGLPYARYQAEKMYKKEDFVFQIDAHSRFVKNWDSIAIEMFNKVGNEFGVLSSYPKATDKSRLIPKKYNTTVSVGICESEVKKSRPLCKVIKPKGGFYVRLENQEPVISPYFAGGLSFARGHRIEKVPSDPHLKYVFEGEEIGMAIRLWTHGYDIYTPSKDLIFHVYGSQMGVNRKVFWKDDYHDGKKLVTRLSYWRLHVVMGTMNILLPEIADSDKMKAVDLEEIERFGTGNRRDKSLFWDWAMIDLKKGVSENICGNLMNGGLKRVPLV